MNQIQATLKREDITKKAVLYMAFELGNKRWKLAFSDGNRIRQVGIDAGDGGQLDGAMELAKARFGLDDQVRVISCYEAGRDGFWLHRYLESCGVDNVVVDSCSIEVSRRKRRVKTDRLDAGKLVQMLMRYCWGERKVWGVVRVPSVEDEDGRHLHRELETLKKERTMHRNRIRSLLKLHGIVIGNPSRKDFADYLDLVRLWDGTELPCELKGRLKRECERLTVVQEQIRHLEQEREQRLQRQDTVHMRRIAQLMALCGIGITSAWTFEQEFFGWRQFRNRREVAALAGLTPTPFDSGGSSREQGISKAGNRRIRSMIIQIAWKWLRYQPQSKLSRWFDERFAHGGRRMRRIGIVAVARRLLIDLWRFLEHGLIPEGARVV